MASIPYRHFGRSKRLVRSAHVKTQQKTAQGFGVGRSYLSRAETRTKPPLSREKTELLFAFLDQTSAEVSALEKARALWELRFMVPATLMPGQIELAISIRRALTRLSAEADVSPAECALIGRHQPSQLQ